MKSFPLYQTEHYETIADYVTGIGRLDQKPAITQYGRKQEQVTHLTYRALTDRIWALGSTLKAQGLAGKHVAIVGENSCDWLTVFLAVAVCGGVAVCIDVEQSDDSIRQMLMESDTVAVFASATYIPIVQPLLEGGAIGSLVAMDADTEELPRLDDWAEQGMGGGEATPGTVRPDQTAAICFTSGTTSRSKQVMLSHRNLMQNIEDSARYVTFGAVVYTSLPFYHTYGLACSALGALWREVHLFINGNLKTAMRDLRLAQPDSMLTVPLMVEAIYKQIMTTAEQEGQIRQMQKEMKKARILRKLGISYRSKLLLELWERIIGSLKVIICGGAHLNPKLIEVLDLFGIDLLQGYGITECAPLISVNPNRANRWGSVGAVMPSCEVKIVEGEVWVRGANVMQGYYNDPALTAEALQDGWFCTGDLGYQDKEGYLFLTGRKKNLVVFKNGKKLSPEKLEEMLMQVPLVQEVLVYGTASGGSTDDVKLAASIYPDPDQTEHLSAYEILEALQGEVDKINADLPLYQQIQLVNIREREFDKTSTKKIKRYAAL